MLRVFVSEAHERLRVGVEGRREQECQAGAAVVCKGVGARAGEPKRTAMLALFVACVVCVVCVV